MGEENRTVEVHVPHSLDALRMIVGLCNEDPTGDTSIMDIVGNLRAIMPGREGYLNMIYNGREDIAERLERYQKLVDYDGSHEAMMATMMFGARRSSE